MYNLPKLIGTWFTVSIVGVSSLAAEQRCTMVNTSMYDGLLTRVPFLSETLNSLKSAKNIQINGQDLTLAGRTKQVDASGKWTSFISIRCQRNNNDWSPCGEPNAKFSLSKVSENKITGSVHIPWEYGSMYPPLFSIEYSCKTSGKIARQTNNTNSAKPSLAPQDNIRSAFNSYSLQKRKEIQLALKKDGFYRSSIDGLYGKGTRRAIEDFASQNGYSILNEQGVNKTLTSVLKGAVEEEPKQVVIATTVNVTKSEPKVDSGMATSAETSNLVKPSNDFQNLNNVQTMDQAQRLIDEVQATILMYMAIREVVIEQPQTTKERVLGVVDNEITRMQNQKLRLQERLTKKFTTPVRPTNANLQVSAFRASETFPKVPFYIPGTNEIGETIVTPRVSDQGFLNYKFDFIDPVATYDKVRDSALIPHESIDEFITGMGKIDEWTQVAQENNVTRRISKTAACIPSDACEVKKSGNSSTELIFQIYEDGSTSGRMQINKGQFSVGYNMSVESTILLQAYLIYMRELGSKEFNVGVMSDAEVLELFD